MNKSGELLISEPVSPYSKLVVPVSKVIVDKKTKYQHVIIAETLDFGKVLVLDGYIQSSINDEFYYHESLVHPALFTHPNPQNVLIIGGGEGATLREVLKHKTIKKAIMVDIDGELLDIAKEYLSEMHQGSFFDPRSVILVEDGFKYVMETQNKFDVVIIDLIDPYIAESIASPLYEKHFYDKIKSILNSEGIMVTQAGNSFFYKDVYQKVLSNIYQVFPIVKEYNIWIPCYGYSVNYILGSLANDPGKLNAQTIRSLMIQRNVKTRFYSPKIHLNWFRDESE
ncbi:MAG: polyamine aminopropyltransferase [Thermoprotei archaeon]|jgi:spermidine synthase